MFWTFGLFGLITPQQHVGRLSFVSENFNGSLFFILNLCRDDDGEVAARCSPADVSPCVEGKDSARQQVQTQTLGPAVTQLCETLLLLLNSERL